MEFLIDRSSGEYFDEEFADGTPYLNRVFSARYREDILNVFWAGGCWHAHIADPGRRQATLRRLREIQTPRPLELEK